MSIKYPTDKAKLIEYSLPGGSVIRDMRELKRLNKALEQTGQTLPKKKQANLLKVAK